MSDRVADLAIAIAQLRFAEVRLYAQLVAHAAQVIELFALRPAA